MPWRHNFFFLSFPKASLPEFSCPMLAPSNAVTNDKKLLAALNAINPKFGSFYENVFWKRGSTFPKWARGVQNMTPHDKTTHETRD